MSSRTKPWDNFEWYIISSKEETWPNGLAPEPILLGPEIERYLDARKIDEYIAELLRQLNGKVYLTADRAKKNRKNDDYIYYFLDKKTVLNHRKRYDDPNQVQYKRLQQLFYEGNRLKKAIAAYENGTQPSMPVSPLAQVSASSGRFPSSIASSAVLSGNPFLPALPVAASTSKKRKPVQENKDEEDTQPDVVFEKPKKPKKASVSSATSGITASTTANPVSSTAGVTASTTANPVVQTSDSMALDQLARKQSEEIEREQKNQKDALAKMEQEKKEKEAVAEKEKKEKEERKEKARIAKEAEEKKRLAEEKALQEKKKKEEEERKALKEKNASIAQQFEAQQKKDAEDAMKKAEAARKAAEAKNPSLPISPPVVKRNQPPLEKSTVARTTTTTSATAAATMTASTAPQKLGLKKKQEKNQESTATNPQKESSATKKTAFELAEEQQNWNKKPIVEKPKPLRVSPVSYYAMDYKDVKIVHYIGCESSNAETDEIIMDELDHGTGVVVTKFVPRQISTRLFDPTALTLEFVSSRQDPPYVFDAFTAVGRRYTLSVKPFSERRPLTQDLAVYLKNLPEHVVEIPKGFTVLLNPNTLRRISQEENKIEIQRQESVEKEKKEAMQRKPMILSDNNVQIKNDAEIFGINMEPTSSSTAFDFAALEKLQRTLEETRRADEEKQRIVDEQLLNQEKERAEEEQRRKLMMEEERRKLMMEEERRKLMMEEERRRKEEEVEEGEVYDEKGKESPAKIDESERKREAEISAQNSRKLMDFVGKAEQKAKDDEKAIELFIKAADKKKEEVVAARVELDAATREFDVAKEKNASETKRLTEKETLYEDEDAYLDGLKAEEDAARAKMVEKRQIVERAEVASISAVNQLENARLIAAESRNTAETLRNTMKK